MFSEWWCSECGQDPQGQEAPKCLKTLVFSGIFGSPERVFICRKPRWQIWKDFLRQTFFKSVAIPFVVALELLIERGLIHAGPGLPQGPFGKITSTPSNLGRANLAFLNHAFAQAVLDGVATLKVREGAFEALNKGSGALGKWSKVVAPSGAPPEELYDLPERHPPFSSFSSFSGVWGAKPLLSVGRTQIRHFRSFRQNVPFLAGVKNTVYQKHGLCHPDQSGLKMGFCQYPEMDPKWVKKRDVAF